MSLVQQITNPNGKMQETSITATAQVVYCSGELKVHVLPEEGISLMNYLDGVSAPVQISSNSSFAGEIHA